MVVVAIPPSNFLLFLKVVKLSLVKFCSHNFTVPISVLSIYPGASAITILLSINCFDMYPIHNWIVLFISATQSKSKKSCCPVIGLGVHLLFSFLSHVVLSLLYCS